MKTPLDKYMKEYKTDMWKEYTIEELMWWVLNLTRRCTHRKNFEKAKKDILDATNYLWMLEKAIEEELDEGYKMSKIEK